MEYLIKAQRRERKGRGAAKKYRKDGYIPVVLYGRGEKNVHALIEKKELMKFLHKTHGESVTVTVDIEGERKQAIVKDVQLDPITDEIIHLDFQILHADEEIEVEVPVILVGVENAPASKAGGLIELLRSSLNVKALPKNIPSHIEIDVSGLKLGDVIHVKDIKAEGYTIVEDPDTPIVTVYVKRGVKEEESPEESLEG